MCLQVDKMTGFILGVIIMDCLIIPIVLGQYYPGYNHGTMVLSVLGGKESPVRWIYNFWIICLGVVFIGISISLFQGYKETSYVGALLLVIVTMSYALFDCFVSGVFSIGSSKEMVTLGEKIHGYGSAIGCTLFLFAGLLGTFLLWKNHVGAAVFLLCCFILAFITFGIFVMGEDITTAKNSWEKIISQTGLWQRISFFLMYTPYVILSIYKK